MESVPSRAMAKALPMATGKKADAPWGTSIERQWSEAVREVSLGGAEIGRRDRN